MILLKHNEFFSLRVVSLSERTFLKFSEIIYIKLCVCVCVCVCFFFFFFFGGGGGCGGEGEREREFSLCNKIHNFCGCRSQC